MYQNEESPGLGVEGRKIFIGGLPPTATDAVLRMHFSKYGPIIDCVLMIDRNTQQSRGFGFVTMLDPSSAMRILADVQIIEGKVVDCKAAVPRQVIAHSVPPQLGSRKVFVGGLPQDITDVEFKEFFSQYGDIEDSVVIYDRETGRARGFGFVTYRRQESLEQCLSDPGRQVIKGKWVEVKRATPREEMQPSQYFTPPYVMDEDKLEYPHSSLINDVLRDDI